MPPVRKSRVGVQQQLSSATFSRIFEEMVETIEKAIKGKPEVIRLALTAMLAEGNILFEDVPGTGKTMLARAIGQTIDAEVGRIQCTPDLLPADVTGSPVLDRKSGDFVFRPGPIFANIFLADEINRATPKTQSAFLEAMQERTVTVDGVTHKLPSPFFVLATQNPIELAGTFPLPEAQLDRFLFKLSIGYLDRTSELEMMKVNARHHGLEEISPVAHAETIVAMIDWAAGVNLSEAVALYVVDLVHSTRTDPSLQLGASSRACLALQAASRVLAASEGREDVIPDDVKKIIKPVLAHRLMITPEAELRGETVDHVIERVVAQVRVPMGQFGRATAGTPGR